MKKPTSRKPSNLITTPTLLSEHELGSVGGGEASTFDKCLRAFWDWVDGNNKTYEIDSDTAVA